MKISYVAAVPPPPDDVQVTFTAKEYELLEWLMTLSSTIPGTVGQYYGADKKRAVAAFMADWREAHDIRGRKV